MGIEKLEYLDVTTDPSNSVILDLIDLEFHRNIARGNMDESVKPEF